MPQPPAAPPNAKKKRQRIIIIGAAGAALLLLLYLRSRSSSSPNATSATDAQAAAAQQAALNAQNAQNATPSTFADNGANAGALADSVTTGLGNVSTALQDLQAAQGQVNASAGDVPPATVPPGAGPAITFNISSGQPAGTSPGGAGSRGTSGRPPAPSLPRGDKSAPFGHNKPAAPRGYTAVGLGSGYWAFKPVRVGNKPPAKKRR